MRNAEELYQIFTQFEPDNRQHRIFIPWLKPNQWTLLGEGVKVDYRSDKWTGRRVDYTHEHTTSPIYVLGESPGPGYDPAPIYIAPPPDQRFAMLGKRYSHCLEIALIDGKTEQLTRLDFSIFPSYPWIGAHPNGNTLIVCYAGQSPILITGPGLQVTERGIVG